MARYTKAVCRLCRREGRKLFLKGAKCYSGKCTFEKKPHSPGQHGNESGRRGRRPHKPSDYALQLREKQKARRIFGTLERQFRRYVHSALRARGISGEELLRRLELRLDNVVFRGGLAASRAQARQLVRHRHFMVNGRTVDIPSYQCKVGDVVQVREKSRTKPPIVEAAGIGPRSTLTWLESNPERLMVTVRDLPPREEMEGAIDEQVIVEYYSR